MVIKWFRVKELFGIYDYFVDFEKIGSNVSVIYAMNGRGKTTIFNMIEALLLSNVDYLDMVPFKSFKIGLNDGTEMSVVKDNVFRRMLDKHDEDYRDFPLTSSENVSQEFLDWFGNMHFHYNDDQVPLSVICTPYRVNEMEDYLKAWFIFDIEGFCQERMQRIGFLDVKSVEANRLTRNVLTEDGKFETRRTIDECQKDLRIKMNAAASYYARTAEKFDVAFPVQVMRKLASEDKEKGVLTKEEIEEKLSELNDVRETYRELGLIAELDPAMEGSGQSAVTRAYNIAMSLEELTSLLTSEMSLETRIFLTQYVSNAFEKFKEYEEVAENMLLFKEYVNSQSEYCDKEMKYEANRGFVFVSKITGREIPTKWLSSGELNNLILFYEMIFMAEKGGLVLIDEPEISLHAMWQRIIIDELTKICDRNETQVIVSTHSPEIMRNHLDITIGLDDGDEDDE